MKKNLILHIIFIFYVSLHFSCRTEAEKTPDNNMVNEQKKELFVEAKFDYLPKSNTNQVVIHQYYTLSYNEEYEQAEWVAYTLKRENLKGNNFDRPFFIQDSKVKTGSSDWRNYKKSGYDKGHLCPAGDMKFSKKAFDETFLTSNISPQKHDFNDGVWNRLEQKIRFWASKYGKVYVITGGVLNDDLKTIGREEVAVPEYFYKIVATNTNGKIKMIGFLIPHQDSDVGLYNFVTSVDEIEKMTKIDFFPKLDDKLENKLEASDDYKDWSFN
ncbi:DNA/RNA non-specific endonuclease [Flavobacterium dankookense]|uniref:Endonuclease G n=1 Tax=Flavobacterium dankookense TaxID=706186 RepID=A0A4R6Q927_9FLAO|nr:endonuclease G [Flavobacterium dankookense]